ncbi:sterol desaturase family protein, partial [Saccharothrix sp. NPDC042600]
FAAEPTAAQPAPAQPALAQPAPAQSAAAEAATRPIPVDPDLPGEKAQRLVLAAVVVGVGVAISNPLSYLALAGLVLLTPLERLWPRRRGQKVFRFGFATDIVHLVVSLALVGLLTAVPMTLLRPVLPTIPPVAAWIDGLPLLLQGLIALVVFDLVNYLAHRLQHEVPFLWRFHRIHHSSEQLDWLAGARVHPLPSVMDGLFRAVPALLLGLTEATAGVLAIIVTVSAVLTHANVSWRLPRLSRWWATPEFHHWHHADEPDAINRNYAGVLPIWDRLFGTFHLPDRYPAKYGADRPVPTGWWGQMVDPLRRDRRDHRDHRDRRDRRDR